jgi:hypothetical protein
MFDPADFLDAARCESDARLRVMAGTAAETLEPLVDPSSASCDRVAVTRRQTSLSTYLQLA